MTLKGIILSNFRKNTVIYDFAQGLKFKVSDSVSVFYEFKLRVKIGAESLLFILILDYIISLSVSLSLYLSPKPNTIPFYLN